MTTIREQVQNILAKNKKFKKQYPHFNFLNKPIFFIKLFKIKPNIIYNLDYRLESIQDKIVNYLTLDQAAALVWEDIFARNDINNIEEKIQNLQQKLKQINLSLHRLPKSIKNLSAGERKNIVSNKSELLVEKLKTEIDIDNFTSFQKTLVNKDKKQKDNADSYRMCSCEFVPVTSGGNKKKLRKSLRKKRKTRRRKKKKTRRRKKKKTRRRKK